MNRTALCLGLLPWLTACSSIDSRIAKDRKAFESYGPEVQEKIRAGRVEPGFSRDMVRLALGSPERSYVRSTAGGERQVWAYGQGGGGLRPSLGLSIGTGTRGFGYGGGVSLGGSTGEEALRVIFDGDVVVEVERMR